MPRTKQPPQPGPCVCGEPRSAHVLRYVALTSSSAWANQWGHRLVCDRTGCTEYAEKRPFPGVTRE